MGPVVGLVERHVQDSRLGRLEMAHREPEGEDVGADAPPRRQRLALQRDQLAAWRIGRHGRVGTRVDGDRSGHVLGDLVEHTP